MWSITRLSATGPRSFWAFASERLLPASTTVRASSTFWVILRPDVEFCAGNNNVEPITTAAVKNTREKPDLKGMYFSSIFLEVIFNVRKKLEMVYMKVTLCLSFGGNRPALIVRQTLKVI
jgi:hypothetical protein